MKTKMKIESVEVGKKILLSEYRIPAQHKYIFLNTNQIGKIVDIPVGEYGVVYNIISYREALLCCYKRHSKSIIQQTIIRADVEGNSVQISEMIRKLMILVRRDITDLQTLTTYFEL